MDLRGREEAWLSSLKGPNFVLVRVNSLIKDRALTINSRDSPVFSR